MRTALFVPDAPSAKKRPLHRTLEREFAATVFPLEPGAPFPDVTGFDLVISKLRFRHLAKMDGPSWGATSALRVHWDEDVFHDGLWDESEFRGLWSEWLPSLDFDLIVTTGQRSRDYLTDRGFAAAVVHKGFSEQYFFDEDQDRAVDIAMFGQEYRSRLLARRALTRAGVEVRQVQSPYEQLSDALNRSLASLSCTLDTTLRGGRIMAPLARRLPELLMRTGAAPEPMLKFFESAASGCAPFTDYSPDLEDLGFIDGDTAVVFTDIPELVEKAREYFATPDRLAAIGSQAATLAASRHTWRHRARELRAVVETLM